MQTIAIVGTGPTGLYTFYHLIKSGAPARITLFEKGDTIGVGTPYSTETATRTMLANIASIEIPSLLLGYLDWMQAQEDALLARYSLTRADLSERLFTPRLMLGSYFHDQFQRLIVAARTAGHEVSVLTETEVTDVAVGDGGLWVQDAGRAPAALFDRVILASGHDFAAAPVGGDADVATRYFPNPWSGLIQTDIPAAEVGILGTSLSAIDAAMAVATQHGRFHTDAATGDLRFDVEDPALRITLMSRSGVLPEADFYCPIPYAPLQVMTPDALTAAVAGPEPLDALFELFRAELAEADPAYGAHVDLAGCGADDFADAYFADRLARDPFGWARENLAQVEANKAARVTVAWRYAILRMHEPVEAVIADLPAADRARFDAGLKRVFIDNYAAVPSESIRRLLALRDSGVLRLRALGPDYQLTGPNAEGLTEVTIGAERLQFAVFIDARGQTPLRSCDLPFASLRQALTDAGQDLPEVDSDYALTGVPGFEGRLYLGALPYLMHDRPFVQGITASAEIGAVIAQAVSAAERRQRSRRRRWTDGWFADQPYAA